MEQMAKYISRLSQTENISIYLQVTHNFVKVKHVTFYSNVLLQSKKTLVVFPNKSQHIHIHVCISERSVFCHDTLNVSKRHRCQCRPQIISTMYGHHRYAPVDRGSKIQKDV